MGLPWVIKTLYINNKQGTAAYWPAGDLAFSVIVFLSCSVVCFLVLLLRRIFIRGELGGPPTTRYASALILVLLWVIYIVLCTLKAYDYI